MLGANDMPTLTVDESGGPIRRSHYQGGRERHRGRPNRNRNRQFIAWDGEGYTDPSGHHHYMLFGASTGDTVEHPQLRHRQVFDLLLSVAHENPDAHHVIFAGVYDAIMWTHLLPTHLVQRALAGRVVRYDGYRIQYYRGKIFRLSRTDGVKRSVTVYDVWSFFGTSFVSACREYLGNDDTLDVIESMKLQRSTFDRDMMPEVKRYMSLELDYLVRLMNNLRDRLRAAGIELTMWHGPGAVASKVLANHSIEKVRRDDDRVTPTSRHAYYGGRFEQFRAGRYDGRVYEYDIRSAYPAAIVDLPSLVGLQWRRTRKGKVVPNGLYKVRWDGPPFTIGPLPYRHSNSAIIYPSHGSGWYWGHEVKNLVLYWPDEWYKILDGFVPYGPGLSERPFEWVRADYDRRAALKAAGDPAQLAYKLSLNSIYGKFAQSKGALKRKDGTWRLPRWHQLEYAGMITASCRAKLFGAMIQAKESLLAVETDALFTTVPLDLDIGTGLGQWEESTFDGILYMQSGVYFVKKEDEWKCKTRGFEPRGHTFERWLDYAGSCPDDEPGLTMHSHRFGTIPNGEQFAKWYDQERELRLDGLASKRSHYGFLCAECINSMGPYSDTMHHLIVPETLYGPITESKPHPLPWVRGYRSEPLDDYDDDLLLSSWLD
jgi:hypothetical protein